MPAFRRVQRASFVLLAFATATCRSSTQAERSRSGDASAPPLGDASSPPADSLPPKGDASESAFFHVIDATPNQLRPAATRTPRLRTWINSLSNDGSVVSGLSLLFDAPDASVAAEGDEAFRWTAATGTVGLGFLPACDRGDPFISRSEAGPISADGSILLGSCTATVGNATTSLLFRWTQSSGLMAIAAPPGLSAPHWSGVSTDGTVAVGTAQSVSGDGIRSFQAFRWTQAGGAVGLGTLPGAEGSQALGGMTPNGDTIMGQSGHEIFLWTDATGMVALPTPVGFVFCEPALKRRYVDTGLVAGRCANATSTSSQFFLWTGISTPKPVALPPGTLAEGNPVVTAGGTVVVGTVRGADHRSRGFRWTEATGPVELRLDGYQDCGVTSEIDLWRSTSANGKVVVGDCARIDGRTVRRMAFRWTEASGITPLAPLSGDDGTLALSVSEDGTVITGQSIHTNGPTDSVWTGVLWDDNGTPTSMVARLTSSGFDLHGFQITDVEVSRTDKHLSFGTGTTSAGELRSWIARLP